jgi:hypothetical protein
MVLRGSKARHAGFSWLSLKDAGVDATTYQRGVVRNSCERECAAPSESQVAAQARIPASPIRIRYIMEYIYIEQDQAVRPKSFEAG